MEWLGQKKNLKERKWNQRKAVKDVIIGAAGKFEYGLHIRWLYCIYVIIYSVMLNNALFLGDKC